MVAELVTLHGGAAPCALTRRSAAGGAVALGVSEPAAVEGEPAVASRDLRTRLTTRSHPHHHRRSGTCDVM
jgi:hypothetical protein